MIDPMVVSSAILALVVTPFMAPAYQQRGQGPVPFTPPHPSEAFSPDGVPDIGGFSVVLVIGETQPPPNSTSTQDLPSGARRALNDMREFLPYKHFRVVDSQWMSCCSLNAQSVVAGRLEGPTGIPAANGTGTVVRGYHFSIAVTRSNTTVPLRFILAPEEAGRNAVDAERVRQLERERQDMAAEIELLDQQIQELQKRIAVGSTTGTELGPMRLTRDSLKRKLTDVGLAIEEAGTTGRGRPVVDSSFTMKAGETVVVGTSRLGGDKALIALVTAVKKNATSKNN